MILFLMFFAQNLFADPAPILNYTALGDSITWGEDSSSPCVPDSPEMLPGNCADGTSFADRFAERWSETGDVSFQDLGIRGGRIDNLLEMSVPKIQSGVNFITIYMGTNDLHDVADQHGNPAAVDHALKTFETKYANLISGLESKHPGVRIVLLNVPNLSYLKYFQQWGPDFVKTLNDVSIRFDRDFINPYANRGYTVVDMVCDPDSYDPRNLYTDGLHPIDRGYQKIANKLFEAVTTGRALPTSCKWFE